MKKDIHPKYYTQSKVTCACGNEFKVGSTLAEIRVEICSQCHPFYTGKQKLIDTARRVEKFQDRIAKKSKVSEARKGKKVKKVKIKKMRSSKEKKVKPDKVEKS